MKTISGFPDVVLIMKGAIDNDVDMYWFFLLGKNYGFISLQMICIGL